jgi:DNA repair protein RecN (Recombination protein N)
VLRTAQTDQATRTAEYREAMAEIDAGRLRAGEEEELREERRRLMNAERLAEGANGAYRELYDDPASAVERAGRAASLLRDLVRLDPRVQPTVQALDTALVHLDETARALRSYRDGVVFDPPRLEAIERRVDEIGRLKRKFGESVDAVLAHRARLETDFEGLARAGEDEGRLVERVERLRTELATRATDLAERRDQAVSRLETAVMAELTALDLESAAFRVRLGRERAAPGELPVGPEGWRLGPKGVDHAEFLFSANAGEDVRPLARIASGGELSRTMLALKVVLAATDGVPVLIFDEVDVGIGGKTADTVGKKLRQVARTRQVLCVTHLPQIAAYADQHFRVEKREEDGRTATTVAVLVKNDRVREVARMLGGESVTDTSLQHALELITQARGK